MGKKKKKIMFKNGLALKGNYCTMICIYVIGAMLRTKVMHTFLLTITTIKNT